MTDNPYTLRVPLDQQGRRGYELAELVTTDSAGAETVAVAMHVRTDNGTITWADDWPLIVDLSYSDLGIIGRQDLGPATYNDARFFLV